MKLLKYIAKVEYIDNHGKNVEINTNASSAQELLKNLNDIFSAKSKWNILNIFK